MKTRLYWLWLHFLRYANTIDHDAAKRSGNAVEKMWCGNRIAQLDQQIHQMEINL